MDAAWCRKELMNAKTVVFGAIVFGLASAALSINDTRPSTNQYRRIIGDGLYAYVSKKELRRITKHHTHETEPRMVDGGSLPDHEKPYRIPAPTVIPRPNVS